MKSAMVVPAHSLRHAPRKRGIQYTPHVRFKTALSSNASVYWVPAFAGTTVGESLPELRQLAGDLLLAVDHFGNVAHAVDVAFVVPGGFDEDARLVLRRDG